MSGAAAGLDRGLNRVFDFELRIPRPLRAPYRGAVCILGMALGVGGKVLIVVTLLAFATLVGPWRGVLLFVLLLLVSMGAGALAGAVYGVLWPAARLGDFGVWFRWAVSLFVYLALMVLLLPNSPWSLDDPAVLTLAGAAAALGGFGIVLTDDRGPGRPSPGEFLRRRQRMLLRTAPGRGWAALQRTHRRYQERDAELTTGNTPYRETPPALRRLLVDWRADLEQARRALARHLAEQPGHQTELDAWIAELDRRHAALPAGPPRN